MKKAGIITIWDLWNLGNRLQNYAVTHIAKKSGLEPLTIAVGYSDENRIIENIKYIIFKLIFRCTYGKNIKSLVWLRAKKFKDFTREHIPYTCSNSTGQNFYDYLLIGSDQIWNADIVSPSEFIYGGLVDSSKRICIAPSFGVTEFDSETEQVIAKYIENIKYLNIRELSGAYIIKRLIGKDVPTFLDPTLMLSANEWLKLEKRPKRIGKRKYILKYFLGGESRESLKEAERICDRYGYDVVDVLDKRNPYAFIAGPSEFIFLIHHAEMILTDSFHACVFSILFGRPFWVYNRIGERMNSRMESLFSILQVDNRFEHNINDPFDIDYQNVNRRLDAERKRFYDFLEQALSGK